MSHTDSHIRPAKRPDYGDRIPHHFPKPTPRKARTRRGQLALALREWS